MKPRVLLLGAAVGLAASAALFTSLSAQTPPPAARTVWDGVYTSAQANRGRAIYNERCVACHGTGLEGADVNPPLAGARFLANWRGKSVRDLTMRTRTTMPLDDPGSLTVAETADITAYLLMRNRFPAGSSELGRTAQLQQRIQITDRR